MNADLDNKLCEQYPKIFRDRHAPMSTTAMCWGFAHGDGWYNIVDKMCANIQSHIKITRQQRHDALVYNRALSRACKGDFSTYNKLKVWQQHQIDRDLKDPEPQLRRVPQACPQVIAIQVKEKYGTLRFYYYGGDEYCRGVEALAESLSSTTCEVCGSPGKSVGGHWVRVLCKQHAEEDNYYWDDDNEQV